MINGSILITMYIQRDCSCMHSNSYNECASECCIEGVNDKEVLPSMRWQACMLSRELILEGVAPLKKSGMTQYGKWPKQENCKATFENVQKSDSKCSYINVLK